MRRLEIAVSGSSQAMAELALELELHGHGVVRIESPASHGPVDLLIDDGTAPCALQARSRLEVRVSLDALADETLPQPVVVFRDGAQPVSYTHLTLPTTPYV